jgi:hypothetical protein
MNYVRRRVPSIEYCNSRQEGTQTFELIAWCITTPRYEVTCNKMTSHHQRECNSQKPMHDRTTYTNIGWRGSKLWCNTGFWRIREFLIRSKVVLRSFPNGNPIRVSHATSECFSMMRLSSVSGTLVLNLIEHGRRFPFMNAMSSNGSVRSRVSWKAQRIRSEVMNTDLGRSR